IFGILGAALNWFYLSSKAQQLEMISFLGVPEGVTISEGTEFQASHFVEVRIPKAAAGNLEDFVYLYRDMPTIEHLRATKAYPGGSLIFKQDMRTPATQLNLAPDEVLLTIAVANRSPLIQPGDRISFSVPNLGGSGGSDEVELIGPFKVAAIGNQIGSRDVMEAHRIQPIQSNQIGIVARMENGQLEAKARTLMNRMGGQGARELMVVWHGQDNR
ncbi:MAG: hypothetical protein R3B96_15885, partial [Pirellulaceae bacterium]